MNILHPYTSFPSIDQHRRDAAHASGEQHRLSCACHYCTERRLDNMMFIAAKRGRDSFGSPEAVRILGPEFIAPKWMVCGAAINEVTP